MTQDTRKDPRAKIVSLNVRYKSATVDEFIENHSYDVSKGGIFIKTPTPFPPGTLLKFEIRIAGDKAVISGVGRVVWKREAGGATPERPSGMGVKFIKLDDSSRAVIDKLVDAKGPGAGAAFEEGNTEVTLARPPPAAGSSPAVPFDVTPSSKMQAAPPAAQPAQPRLESPKAEPSTPSPISRRPAQTVIGIGQPAPKPAAAPASSVVPAPPPSSPGSVAPPLRVAPPPAPARRPAESGHLADAPKPVPGDVPKPARPAAGTPAAPPRPAAGEPAGSYGGHPQTPAGQSGAKPAAAASSMFPKTDSLKEMPPTGEQTVMKQAAELLEEALRGAGGSMEEIGSNPLFDVAMKTAPANGSTTPAKVEVEPDLPLLPSDEPEGRMTPTPTPTPLPRPVSVQPPAVGATAKREVARESARPRAQDLVDNGARATPAPPPEKGGSKAIIYLASALAVGAIGYLGYSQLFDTESSTTTSPVPSDLATPQPAPPPPSAAVPASASPPPVQASASAASSASPPGSAALAASASAAPATSASAAPPPSASASVAPAVRPPPVAPPPVAPPPVTVRPAPQPQAAPPPRPAPKPKKPADDDNPY